MSDISDLINDLIKKRFIDGLFTALPAEVLAVNEFQSLQVIDVQPLLGVTEDDGVELTSPVINNVPVVQMGGGGALISIPIAVGDTVLIIFTMRDIADWKRGDGSYTTTESSRLHDINDAIAITGLYTSQSTLNPDPNDVVIKFKESEIRLSSDDVVTIKAKKVVVDHTDLLELGKGATKAAFIGADLESLLKLHVHPTGVGTSGVTTTDFSSALSTTVKVT